MKLKAPKNCRSLSLEGKNIPIINGEVEVNTHITFLLENGFSAIIESAVDEADDLLEITVEEKTTKKSKGK